MQLWYRYIFENKANVFSTDLIHVYKNNDQHKGKSFLWLYCTVTQIEKEPNHVNTNETNKKQFHKCKKLKTKSKTTQ